MGAIVLDLSPETLEAMRVRLDRHLYGSAKALSQNAIVAARLADSSPSPWQAGDGSRRMQVPVDSANPAGSGTAANGPFSTPEPFEPTCADCIAAREDGLSRNGACATHRRACEGCGRDDVPLHGDLVGEKGLAELWCDHCDPPVAVGEKFADAEQDPWDLASEELALTRELPREEPKYWGRDRGEYDPLDDKSDLQPFTRVGRP